MTIIRSISERVSPFIIGMTVFVMTLILTQYLSYQRFLINRDNRHNEVLREMNAVKERLSASLSNSLSATRTLSFFVERYGVPENFNEVARDILEANKNIDALELTNGGIITHIYPLRGNEAAIGYNVLADLERNKEAQKAIEKRSLFFAGPLELKQGGMAVVGRLPIFKADEFKGFSVVIIKLSTLLEAAGIDTGAADFYYQLSKKDPVNGKEVFFLPLHPFPPEDEKIVSVKVPDGEWKLYVMSKENRGLFNVIILSLLGLILSVISGFFAWQMARQPEKLRLLVNEKTHQLTTREKYYRSLTENSADAIVLMDDKGKVIYQTPSTEKTSGYSLAEMQAIDGLTLIHPDDQLRDAELFEQLVQQPGVSLKRKHRFRHKDGHYIWLEGTYTNLLNDENVRAIVYNYYDATERIEAEQKSKASYRLYQLISRINQLMVHVKDEQSLFSEACEIAVNLGGFRMAWVGMADETGKKVVPVKYAGSENNYLSDVLSASLANIEHSNGPTGTAFRTGRYVLCNDIANNPMMAPWVEEALKRGYSSSIALPIKKSGKVAGTFNLYSSEANFFDEKEIDLLVETSEDISFILENFEREKMRQEAEEEVLKVYKEKETTLNRIDDSVVSLDNEWRYTFLNDAAQSTHPLGKDKTIGRIIWDEHPEMKGTIFWNKYHEAMDTKKVVEFEEFYPPMNIWFYVKVYPSADGLTIFYNDITWRKKAEAQVTAEKILSDSIINSLPGIFYLYDRNGQFLRWNLNFETVSGYDATEIRNMRPLQFFHEDEAGMMQQKIDTVFESGNADISAPFYTKDRKKIPYYFNGRKVNFNGTDYLIGMGIDITDRIAAENELRERNSEIQLLTAHLERAQEEERTRISREIHDELGQQLTGLKMDVFWIEKRINTSTDAALVNESAAVKEKISTIVTLIDETIRTVRRIAYELRPGILDDLGLMAAIESQAEEFEKRTGIKSLFISKLQDYTPERDISTHIFRVYQEALTNIARHADATEVITTIEQRDNHVLLTIKDNGHGFDKNLLKSGTTLGILGMKERALLFHGTFVIESAPEGGTVVTFKIPILHQPLKS